MQELIKVQEEGGQQRVSARELYEFLSPATHFKDWIERMFEYDMGDEQERRSFLSTLPSGQKGKDYLLTLETAKEIAMLQRSEKGKVARKYFIACEKKLKAIASTPSYLLDNPAERARRWAVEYEEKIALENKRAVLATKNEKLETQLDELLQWVSIIKVARHNKVDEKCFNWRTLKKKSIELGVAIKKAESPRYKFQNLYHLDVWKHCYKGYDYDMREVKQ